MQTSWKNPTFNLTRSLNFDFKFHALKTLHHNVWISVKSRGEDKDSFLIQNVLNLLYLIT